VDKRISSHTDLSVFHFGNELIYAAPYLRSTTFAERLYSMGVRLSYPEITQGEKYPHDTQLNACPVGQALFYSPGISADEIVDHYSYYELIPVKQAYCGCSICVVDSESIITADNAIAAAAKAHNIDALLISPGNIELPGFKYGFIGGSAFKISSDCMAFTGQLDALDDRDRILAFLRERGISAKFITNLPIFDIGNGIIITEK